MAPLPPYTLYLTGVRTDATDSVVNLWDGPEGCPLGLLVQPLTERYLDDDAAGGYDYLAIDNGAFTKIGQERFDEAKYLRLIKKGLDRWGDNVLFATAPDVAFKWRETLQKSLPFLPKIRAAGAPAALVLQNGATPDNIPWDACDAIFLGGGKGDDTGGEEWKVTPVARDCAREALRRRKWVHMGRVNTEQRMRVAQDFGCGSADGTYLMHETPFATAVIALEQVAIVSAHRWARGADPERAVAKVVAALDALRSPPGRRRDKAIQDLRQAGLLRGGVKDLVEALNLPMLPGEDFWFWGKRKRDAMVAVAEECALTVARESGESVGSVRENIARMGDDASVQDILSWLRMLRSRFVKHKMAEWKSAIPDATRRPFEAVMYQYHGVIPSPEDYRGNPWRGSTRKKRRKR